MRKRTILACTAVAVTLERAASLRTRGLLKGAAAGAVCFAIGGVIQAFDRPTPTRMVVQQAHEHTEPA